jgi:hypothetical protein
MVKVSSGYVNTLFGFLVISTHCNPSALAQSTYQTFSYKVRGNSCVNFRAEPSISAKIIHCLKSGTYLDVVRIPPTGKFAWSKDEADHTWYLVFAQDTKRKGWVMPDCIDIFEETSSKNCADYGSNKPTPYPPESLGSLDYYQLRYNDFMKRNPSQQAPNYYLEFGNKYLNKFVNKTYPNLTKKGQQFVKAVGKALQQEIEAKLVANPDAFEELELSPDSFRKFAYGTHPDAYCQSGWGNLPRADREKIIEAIDWKDKYGSVNGWKSMIGLINRCVELDTIDAIIDGIPGATPLAKSLFVLGVISFTGLGLRGLYFWIAH